MRSLGPVLAMTGVTLANDVVVNHFDIQQEQRVIVGGAVVAAALGLLEQVWEDGAVALAWLGLVTVLFVRVTPGKPAPLEAFANWYQKK